MPSPKGLSRLLLVVFTLSLFLPSTATAASSGRFRRTRWYHRTLAASSSSVAFGNVQVGSSQTQYETLTNSSNSTVTISQATVTGAGFSLSGLSLPLSLNQGQSVTFSILFTPQSGGTVSGTVAVVSNASNPSLAIAVSGTGVSAGRLASSATALNFGSVAVGTSKALTVDLTATGSSVTISSATSTSSEFRLTGLSLPQTIAAGQSTSVSVTFTPQVSGAASGSISLASNAANTPVVETLAGSGTAAPSHTVTLQWSPSTSAVAGYNLYRSTVSGGPYAKINSVLAVSTTFLDSSVQAGKTYYYVGTAVSSGGVESKYSNQLQAVIPSP